MEMNDLVKTVFVAEHPDDELGRDIHESLTFNDVWDCLCNDPSKIYEVLGVFDSLVREFVFGMLSQRLGVEYRVVYDKWLEQ